MTVNRSATEWLIRWDGDSSISSAAELKSVLLEGLAARPELELDLTGASEVGIAILQLLWAFARAAREQNCKFASQVPEVILCAARDAGFEGFPGDASAGSPEGTMDEG